MIIDISFEYQYRDIRNQSSGDAMAIEAGIILSEWDSDTFN